jgi:N-acyl-phosphatidylethanolamine-hydrolysing phospholipase D
VREGSLVRLGRGADAGDAADPATTAEPSAFGGNGPPDAAASGGDAAPARFERNGEFMAPGAYPRTPAHAVAQRPWLPSFMRIVCHLRRLGARRPRPRRPLGLLLALPLLLAACATTNEAYDPAKPHHRPDGFANLHPSPHGEPEGSFWRWQWERWRADLPADRPERITRATPDAQLVGTRHGHLTVTWLGHSTALWQINGLNILTDPHLTARASPVSFAGPQRLTPPPLTLQQLPRIDVVLISHNHYDHLDEATVRGLAQQAGGPPLFLVPLGVERWMAERGITRIQRMDWWERHELPSPRGPVTVHFVPSHHWSSRTPWDRSATLWGGFVAQTTMGNQPVSLYFAGDTGYAPDFAEIGRRFGGFDFSMIPVGCYLPRWFMRAQHVNEEEAVRIHQDVKSRLSIGIHWGTFRLCDDPIDSPIDGLPAARERLQVPADAFVLPVLGQTRVLRRAEGP